MFRRVAGKPNGLRVVFPAFIIDPAAKGISGIENDKSVHKTALGEQPFGGEKHEKQPYKSFR